MTAASLSHNIIRLVLRRLCCQSSTTTRAWTSHAVEYGCRIRDSSKRRRRTRIWNASVSTTANSKNNSNNKTINNGSSNSNSNSNNHDDENERYIYQPPISEKVTNVFRRRLFNANVDDLDKLHDWRETFSSADYDDPWSAYVPLPTTMTPSTTMAFGQNSNDNVTKRGRLIESIINKTWHRRRHGMNLEPLLVTIIPPTTTKEPHHNNNDEMVEYATAKTQRIDVQTRYLCRMLDDVYRTGIQREEIDRPTIGRCHRQIGRLLTMTPKDNNDDNDDDDDNNNQPSLSSNRALIIQGAAPRAGEILRRMELSTPPSLLLAQRSVKKADATRFNKDADEFLSYISGTTDIWPPPFSIRSNDNVNNVDDDDDDELQQNPSSFNLAKSYQDLYFDYPRHLFYNNFDLPTPTHAIYTMVLLAYAKENGPIHVAQQAEDVIWSMISRANTAMTLIENDNNDIIGDDALLPLLPTTENWNGVLKCWSRNADIDRAFYAYSFLVSWIEWNRYYNESNNNVDIATPNLESFRLVLRSCLVNDKDDGVSKEYLESLRRAKGMGSGVAVRLWEEMENYSNNNVGNRFIKGGIYHDMIHAICQTTELPSTSSSPSSATRRALRTLASVYKQCSDDGLLTTEMFDCVKGAMSKSQFARLLHGQGGGDGK